MRVEAARRWYCAAILAFFLLAGFAGGARADPLVLKPFKNDLFAYPALLSERDGGAYRVFDYREMRDINGRDTIPEKRVQEKYVSLGVLRVQHDRYLPSDTGWLRYFAVGAEKDAKIITVYLHGQGGSRSQGVDDFTFGGNFNRIKNLMADNGGLYLSPDFSDFGAKGAAQVAAIIGHYLKTSPNAALFVACGSMGGHICWRLADDPAVAPRLSGLLLLGSLWDEDFFKTRAYRMKVPVFFAQGSHDVVFPVARQEAFFEEIRKRSPAYPTEFVRFETGTHGTPIRMVDWRKALNWMLSVSR
ncbi:MAG TPA: alpha/beta hydrolase [Rhizobiaceae bacterium]|nr:alpha/beta hydrolase [Rhizobiaceae bacterium]